MLVLSERFYWVPGNLVVQDIRVADVSGIFAARPLWRHVARLIRAITPQLGGRGLKAVKLVLKQEFLVLMVKSLWPLVPLFPVTKTLARYGNTHRLGALKLWLLHGLRGAISVH